MVHFFHMHQFLANSVSIHHPLWNRIIKEASTLKRQEGPDKFIGFSPDHKLVLQVSY